MEHTGSHERVHSPGRLVRNTETGECFDIESSSYEVVEELSLEGVYEHYKSTPEDPKLYRVEGVVRNIETDECFVVYHPLYETDEELPSARPLSIFTGSATVNGEDVPRFRYREQEL
jgi:hypothetical protein